MHPPLRVRTVRSPSQGFTLVELLVVIAVIALLITMLLPAVNYGREAARRVQCMNNVKQLVLGLNNYESANGVYPAGGKWFNPPGPRNREPRPIDYRETGRIGPSWVVSILPFIEEQNLHDQFELEKPISRSGKNRRARGTRIPTMECPSDSGHHVLHHATGLYNAQGNNWARGNYAGNAMNGPLSTEKRTHKDWKSDDRRGVLGPNIETKLKDMLDGTSKTIIVSEVRVGLNQRDRRGVWAMSGVGSSLLFWHGWSRGSVGPANGPNDASTSSDDIPGCLAIIDEMKRDDVENPVAEMARQKMTCRFNRAVAAPQSGQAGSRSAHRGGVFAGFIDGTVRFIADDIETSRRCCSAWDRLILSRDSELVQ